MLRLCAIYWLSFTTITGGVHAGSDGCATGKLGDEAASMAAAKSPGVSCESLLFRLAFAAWLRRVVSTRSDSHHRSKQVSNRLVLDSTRNEYQARAPVITGPCRKRNRRVK